MKVYKMVVPAGELKNGAGVGAREVSWHASEGAATSARVEKFGQVKDSRKNLKRADITIAPVEVPTDKAGLIEWLNRNVSH